MHFLKTTQEIFLVNISPNPWPTVPVQVQNMKNCKAGDPHTFCSAREESPTESLEMQLKVSCLAKIGQSVTFNGGKGRKEKR